MRLTWWKNQPLAPDTRTALLAGKPARLKAYFGQLWSQPLLPTDQDRLLAALLQPARLLEFLRFLRAVRPQGGQGGGALPAVLRHPRH